LVDDPEIVVLVEPHAVRVTEPVHTLSDLSNELTGLIELEQLRRRVAVERPARRAARVIQDDDVSLRVDGDGEQLAEVHVGRNLQEVGRRVEWNRRHARARWCLRGNT